LISHVEILSLRRVRGFELVYVLKKSSGSNFLFSRQWRGKARACWFHYAADVRSYLRAVSEAR